MASQPSRVQDSPGLQAPANKIFARMSKGGAILITGATGFIGRRVSTALTGKADRQIRCLVHENRSIR